MSKSKNYKWQLNWSVNLDQGTVTHKDGVQFNVKVNSDENGLDFFINKQGRSLEYFNSKKEKLHLSQLSEHLCKLERQARKIYHQKVVQEIES